MLRRVAQEIIENVTGVSPSPPKDRECTFEISLCEARPADVDLHVAAVRCALTVRRGGFYISANNAHNGNRYPRSMDMPIAKFATDTFMERRRPRSRRRVRARPISRALDRTGAAPRIVTRYVRHADADRR